MTLPELSLFFQERDDYLIVMHRNPDGDTVGSAAALCLGLRALGKTAYVLPDSDAPERLAVYSMPLAPPEGFLPAITVAVDIASASLLPQNAPKSFDIAIDHHELHTPFAPVWYCEPVAACGEIIYALLQTWDASISREIAEPLYVSVSTDTGCFRYGNTTPRTHAVAAALLETGFDFLSINEEFFEMKSPVRLALEQAALAGLELLHNGRIALVTLTRDILKNVNAGSADDDDISSLARQIKGVLIGITIRERKGFCKLSVRTARGYSASEICACTGGGGHAQAGGCHVEGDVAAARDKILAAVYQKYPALQEPEEPE